tara:strand:+ start:185 stop:643 length:459 start_codon:yes stop_codon:yes gene_type:complete
MGGFTKVQLRDTSADNIARHNARLEIAGVPKKYRYQSPHATVVEYEWYLAKQADASVDATYPKHMFPPSKIKSFADFQRFWNTDAAGEVFIPPVGALTFDCYFGRMSKKAMRAVAKYLVANYDHIASVDGSFSTFMERGMTAKERNTWAHAA